MTWLEHVEIEDKTPTNRLYRDLIHNGMAFGAERLLATMQRVCERLACLIVSTTSPRDIIEGNFGIDMIYHGKKIFLDLMV